MRSLVYLALIGLVATGCGPSSEQKAEDLEKQLDKETKKLEVMLVNACGENLRSRLKDPFSLREIGSRGYWFGDEYQPPEYFSDGTELLPAHNGKAAIEYTAKNGFGGAVRDTHVCFFDDSKIVAVI